MARERAVHMATGLGGDRRRMNKLAYIFLVSIAILFFTATTMLCIVEEQIIKENNANLSYGIPECEVRPTMIRQGLFYITYRNGIPVWYAR